MPHVFQDQEGLRRKYLGVLRTLQHRREAAGGRVIWRHICAHIKIQLHSINMRHSSSGRTDAVSIRCERSLLLAECRERVYINLPGKYRLPKVKMLLSVSAPALSSHLWPEASSSSLEIIVKSLRWLLDHTFSNVDKDEVTFVENVRKDDKNLSRILLSVRLDDKLETSNDKAIYKDFIDAIIDASKYCDLSDSAELKLALGGKVEQDREKGIVRLSQKQYCSDVLKRFQVNDYTPVDTSSEANLHLAASDSPLWISKMQECGASF